MTVDHVAAHFHEIEEGDQDTFEQMAVVAETFQRRHNPVYAAFEGYRYLPIEAFRHKPVCTFAPEEAEAVFESSGTGGGARSRHFVKRLDLYRRAIDAGFLRRFGHGPYVIAAHLPGYAQASSLVFMVRHLMDRFGYPGSCFFLEDLTPLREACRTARDSGVPLMMVGVTFGLLDLGKADFERLPAGSIVVETGGMKTSGRTLARDELHRVLREKLGGTTVVSEYGMCELLSQFWTESGSVYKTPPWVGFDVVDPLDGLRTCDEGESGALAVFDLANLYSVSAVLTQDQAVRRKEGFEVLGRLEGADLRGCHFLLEGHARH